MKKSNKFSPAVREQAAQMVQDHRGEYPSLWAAVESIAPQDWLRAANLAGMIQANARMANQAASERISTGRTGLT